MHQLFSKPKTCRPALEIQSRLYKLLIIGGTLLLTACGGSSSGGDAAPHQPPIVPETQPPVVSTYPIGGGISGLNMAGLVLQNNDADDLTVATNASSFQFATPVAGGSAYNITVATQPTGLTCTVSHGTGTNVQAAVTNVSVVCNANTHTIAGTITGLTTNGLVLRNNGADDLTIAANATTFQFAAPIAAGGGYSISAFTQPTGLTCTVNDGVGSNVSANINTVDIMCSAITFTVGGTIAGLTGSGLVLQNNNGDDLTVATNATTFEFATPVAYGSNYAVAVSTQPTGQFCSITDAAGTATAQVGNVALACSQTTLTSSVSTLVLSVGDVGLSAALTGTPRHITIINNGSIQATNVSIAYPVWPTGASASSNCGGALAAGQSCTITVTPGIDSTSNCGSAGIAPTPGTITVTADDAPTTTIDAVILSYGCIYQSGYVYSIDDTLPTSGSIGGKVIALTDQVPTVPGSIWSSNGTPGTNASFDIIPGIDETSTTSSGSPTYSAFTTDFNNNYDTSINPAPGSAWFSACNGRSDGACNTSNILTLYNTYITNHGVGGTPYTLSSGPTASSSYAAGSCTQTIGGYSDWYLPAICELGGGASCAAQTPNVVDNLPSLIGDTSSGTPGTSCVYGANCLAGEYWSSTELASSANTSAWFESFSSAGSYQLDNGKSIQYAVRCSRVLTL